jgi:hypothetical protein
MTVNELKYVYIEETMSALGNEELMEAILDAVRKVKVKFQERQEVSDSLFGDVPALPHSIAQLKESLGGLKRIVSLDVLPRARKSFKS